ncbi:MAG: c-type cytochrome [Betaproteobacteria bacterium]|nr:c-type cytochrome [Betaproteobacteria bacterium]
MRRIALLMACAFLLSACGKKVQPPPPPPSTAPSMAPGAPPTPATAPPAATAAPSAPTTAAPGTSSKGPSGPVAMAGVRTQMQAAGCFACHAVHRKLVGPAYAWVADRYKGKKDALALLSKSIKDGSTGKWSKYTGGVAMPPHPQLSDAQIKAMAQWILRRRPVAPPPA